MWWICADFWQKSGLIRVNQHLVKQRLRYLRSIAWLCVLKYTVEEKI